MLAVADIRESSGGEELIALGGSLAVFDSFGMEILPSLETFYGVEDLSAVSSRGMLPSVVVAGTPNAPADTGNTGDCFNTGAAFLYLDGNPDPIILRSPAPIDSTNLFFGWAAYAVPTVGDTFIFVTEKGRDQDHDGIREGQIYVFRVSNES